tara:strand:+ start:1952 stop:3346 length:1395 start_codon:yes stop_codon:yes gene_type:complete
MATTSDVLRSVNLILQSGERRQQREFDTSLAMLQLSSTKELREREIKLKESQLAEQERLSNINIVKSNLELASKSLEMQKPKIAARFLQSTGLGAIYQESEEGEPAEDAITDMAERLRSKQYFGKKFDIGASQDIAGAVWSYYSGEDPNAILSIADNLYESGSAIDSGTASKSQKQLFEAFNNLGIEANLKDISLGASKALDSEMYIDKEISEFLRGDYDIQSPIGVYADVPQKVEDDMAKFNIQAKPKSAKIMSIDETREALSLAEQKQESLRSKVENNLASDEEKEEYYKLPDLINRFNRELSEASDFLNTELDSEIKKIKKAKSAMIKRGLTHTPEYKETRIKLRELTSQKRDISSEQSARARKEMREEEMENLSEVIGVDQSEMQSLIDEKNRRELSLLTSTLGGTSVYPYMREDPKEIVTEWPSWKRFSKEMEGQWVGPGGQDFLDLLEMIGLYNASDS